MQEVCIIRGQSMPATPSTKGIVARQIQSNPAHLLVAVHRHLGALVVVRAVRAVSRPRPPNGVVFLIRY